MSIISTLNRGCQFIHLRLFLEFLFSFFGQPPDKPITSQHNDCPKLPWFS